MQPSLTIVTRRELGRHFQGMTGWAFLTILMVSFGIAYQSVAFGPKVVTTAFVLHSLFTLAFGVVAVGAVLAGMGSMSQEYNKGTIFFYDTAHISSLTMVVGKWIATTIFCLVFLALSIVFPLHLSAHAPVSMGHVAIGYLGLALVACLVSAVTVTCSAMVRFQHLAAVLSLATLGFMIVSWWFAKRVDPPLSTHVLDLAVFERHFARSFADGVLRLQDVVFYLSWTGAFLFAGTLVVNRRRAR